MGVGDEKRKPGTKGWHIREPWFDLPFCYGIPGR
jgi:hypothetical protein